MKPAAKALGGPFRFAAVIACCLSLGVAAAPGAKQPSPQNRTADYDYSRFVRVWISPQPTAIAGLPADGERMILASNVPAPNDLALLASAGFTLLQTDSDHQSTEEVRPEVWDYAGPDRARELALAAGFDWCYFPHFAFPPPWYAQRNAFTRVRCLEHNETIDAFSPWDPNFAAYLNRGYERLAQHYRGQGQVPALYLGVHGDYGEAGMFIGARTAVPGQKEDWQRRFGNLHNHVGWWCGDPLARAAFRSAMAARYGGLEGLNQAWRTRYASVDAIAFPTAPATSSRRHWLDFVQWYRDSVNAMTDMVCRVARRNFPTALLILPVGFGDEDPRNGADNSMLAKIAARHRVELRSTHGGYRPYPENVASMLGRLASACRFYGVPFWTEPPSTITPEGQVARIFESATLGARGHYDWAANVTTGRDAYYRYGKHLKASRRIVDVAMFFPTTAHLLRPGDGFPRTFERGCATIRDLMDFDIVDERMVLDGALDRYRVLVWWEGSIVEASVLDSIRAWVQRGGVLVAYDCGKIETVEGGTEWFRDVFGYAGRLSPAGGNLRFVPASGSAVPSTYRVSVGEPSASPFLEGDWYAPDNVGGVSRRWSGESADLRLPLVGSQGITLTVRASFPAEASGLRREVLVNGTQVGILDLAGEHTYRFTVPASLLSGRGIMRVTFRNQPFVPATVLPGSTDQRRLGVWVTYVQVQPESSAEPAADAPTPEGRFEVAINLGKLRSEWARPLGRGWTIYFPARRDQLAAYCEVVRYAAYNLSDLDPTKSDAIAVDNAWDGVYATLLADRALYYNDGDSRALRTIVLSPSAFSARRDVVRPRTFAHELTLDPHAIAEIPFASPPTEILLQCERFADLKGLTPLEGPTFSRGSGATHVLVPVGGEIGTRFECTDPGSYRVFYRASRRGSLAAAAVLVNGRPCEPATGIPARAAAQTRCAGTATLTRGINTLMLRPLPGQDVRADFVVLTNDRTIAGYGFPVK